VQEVKTSADENFLSHDDEFFLLVSGVEVYSLRLKTHRPMDP